MKKALVCLCCLLFAGGAFAEEKAGPFSVHGDVSVFTRYTKNPKFGGEEGQHGYTPDTTYGEVYGSISLTGETQTEYGTLSGELRPYFVTTLGEDFFGIMKNGENVYAEYAGKDKHPSNRGFDQAWVKLSQAAGLPVDITLGRQDIFIEKGFLIGISGDAANGIWFGGPESFSMALRLDGSLGGVDWTGFCARSDNYRDALEDNVKTMGLNLHYNVTESAYLYGGIYQKDEPRVGKSGSTQIDTYENDTLTYNLGGEVGVGPVVLEGELALQRGDIVDKDRKKMERDSKAYWVSGTYYTEMPMAPYLRLMYQSYSGDGVSGTYDSLHSGVSGWNRFFTGELVGECQMINSNRENIVVEMGLFPSETSMVTLSYINHRKEESQGSKNWADEINLFWDGTIKENITLHLGTGYAIARGAAKKEYGASDDAIFAQMQVAYSF
ncbi:MAG: hypothetical protein MI742_14370 [Desulfobacterales bacterium]|nr:hypothetical protein [Desulfobacterales bacterium]